MANLVCPYCGRAAYFPNTLHAQSPQGKLGDLGPVKVGLSTCPGCGGVVAIGYHISYADSPLVMIPKGTVEEPDELIPVPVREDLYEARLCAAAGAWKATAAMCRRTLQGACLSVGASPGKTLAGQVAEAVAANKVHASLEEWAEAIRLIGNSGAHPGGDGLESVSEEEANDLLDFTEQFLELTFVVSEKVRARVASRKSVAKSTGD